MRRSRPIVSAVALALTAALTAAPAATEASPQSREADDLYRQGAYAEALKRFETILASGQESPGVLYKAAACHEATTGNKERALELKKRAVPLLEKEIASGGSVDSHYYLAAVYINDLKDPVKGTDVARKGVALLEKPKAPRPDTQEGLFRAGRLYSFLGRDKDAAGYYERSIEATSSGLNVDRAALRHALEDLATFRYREKNWAAASTAYAGLLKLDPLRDRDRHQYGLSLLNQGKPDEAIRIWKAALTDELRTELNYLAGVVNKWVGAGSPTTSKTAPNLASLDETSLQKKILEAAQPLRVIREKEAREKQAREDKEREERDLKAKTPMSSEEKERIIARLKAKIAAAKAPQDPNSEEPGAGDPWKALREMGLAPVQLPPPPPTTPEKMAAEREFFCLMAEYVRRGHFIRNFSFENGFVEMIFR